jgi:hypothetical protein
MQEEEAAAKKAEEAYDFALKTEDWRATKQAQAEAREAARRSIAWRVADASRKQAIALSEHEEKLAALHDQLQWKQKVSADAAEYKKECEQRRRLSMAMRLDSWRTQEMAEKALRLRKQMEAEEEARWKAEDNEALAAAKTMLLTREREQLAKGTFVF